MTNRIHLFHFVLLIRPHTQLYQWVWGLFSCIIFFSNCSNPSNIKEEIFRGKPLFTVNYFEIDFIPEATLLLNIRKEFNDSIAYLYDVTDKRIIKYNITRKTFIKSNFLGNDSINIYILNVVNDDSIIISMYPYIAIADMYKIKRFYKYQILNPAYLYPFFYEIELHTIDKNTFIVPLSVSMSDNIRHKYKNIKNNTNMFGIFKFTKDSILLLNEIHLKHPFKEKRELDVVACFPRFVYSKSKNSIFFCYNISDTMYKYDLNAQKITKKRCSYGYPIKPLFYNPDTASNPIKAYYLAGDKQHFITSLNYDDSKKIIYKQIIHKTFEKNDQIIRHNIIQILDYNFNLIKNIIVPNYYCKWYDYINNTIIFPKIDRKKKMVSYEKMLNSF